MIEYIPQALSSLSAATGVISSLMKLRDFSQYAATFTELQGHIIQANSFIISEQQAYLSVSSKVQALEKECMRLKDWSAEKDKYEQKQIATGVFAYIIKGYTGKYSQAHKLCCNCFEKTIKSTLQQSDDHKQYRGTFTVLTCPNGCPRIEFHFYLE